MNEQNPTRPSTETDFDDYLSILQEMQSGISENASDEKSSGANAPEKAQSAKNSTEVSTEAFTQSEQTKNVAANPETISVNAGHEVSGGPAVFNSNLIPESFGEKSSGEVEEPNFDSEYDEMPASLAFHSNQNGFGENNEELLMPSIDENDHDTDFNNNLTQTSATQAAGDAAEDAQDSEVFAMPDSFALPDKGILEFSNSALPEPDFAAGDELESELQNLLEEALDSSFENRLSAAAPQGEQPVELAAGAQITEVQDDDFDLDAAIEQPIFLTSNYAASENEELEQTLTQALDAELEPSFEPIDNVYSSFNLQGEADKVRNQQNPASLFKTELPQDLDFAEFDIPPAPSFDAFAEQSMLLSEPSFDAIDFNEYDEQHALMPETTEASINGLAADANGAAANDLQERYVVFKLGEAHYAFPAASVVEIEQTLPITPLPFVPQWFLGVVNLHGDILPVVGLRELWGRFEGNMQNKTKLLVVQSEKGTLRVGLQVDAVREMRRYTKAEIVDVSERAELHIAPYQLGTVQYEKNQSLWLIDTEKLVASLNP